MKSMKREYLLRKIKYGERLMSSEEGRVSWILGLFWLTFLGILLCMQLQMSLYRASSMYMEDALALSNLASAVIDIQEYGITQRICITDPEQAYGRFCYALKKNLGLNDAFEAYNQKLIFGQVRILNYTIYNVIGDNVDVWQKDELGQVREWQGKLGDVRTPGGQLIETTGVYSEITYPIEGFWGIRVVAQKGKFIDVIREGQDKNEKT